jgi:hypothetical protein
MTGELKTKRTLKKINPMPEEGCPMKDNLQKMVQTLSKKV